MHAIGIHQIRSGQVFLLSAVKQTCVLSFHLDVCESRPFGGISMVSALTSSFSTQRAQLMMRICLMVDKRWFCLSNLRFAGNICYGLVTTAYGVSLVFQKVL